MNNINPINSIIWSKELGGHSKKKSKDNKGSNKDEQNVLDDNAATLKEEKEQKHKLNKRV